MEDPAHLDIVVSMLSVAFYVLLFVLIVKVVHGELTKTLAGMWEALPKKFRSVEGWVSLVGVGLVAAILLSLFISSEASSFMCRMLGLPSVSEAVNPNAFAGLIVLCFLVDLLCVYKVSD